jgi:putative oxidoreductase
MRKENTYRGDIGLFLLRLSTGGLLIFHGVAKIAHGHDFIRGMLADKGLPQFLWLGVPLTEVLAPLLLVLGVFTRAAAASIVILMVFTVVLAHSANAFTISETGGLEIELNLLYMFGALVIVFTGPGRFALYKPVKTWQQ